MREELAALEEELEEFSGATEEAVKRLADKVRELEEEIRRLRDEPTRAAGALVYRGIWHAELAYSAGQAVTHAGALWFAHRDTRTKPGSDGSDWQMMTKAPR